MHNQHPQSIARSSTPILKALFVALVSSLESQALMSLKESGIISPTVWVSLQGVAGVITFFIYLNWWGWEDGSVIACALAIGMGLGCLSGLHGG